jgi:hypothetical protein
MARPRKKRRCPARSACPNHPEFFLTSSVDSPRFVTLGKRRPRQPAREQCRKRINSHVGIPSEALSASACVDPISQGDPPGSKGAPQTGWFIERTIVGATSGLESALFAGLIPGFLLSRPGRSFAPKGIGLRDPVVREHDFCAYRACELLETREQPGRLHRAAGETGINPIMGEEKTRCQEVVLRWSPMTSA